MKHSPTMSTTQTPCPNRGVISLLITKPKYRSQTTSSTHYSTLLMQATY